MRVPLQVQQPLIPMARIFQTQKTMCRIPSHSLNGVLVDCTLAYGGPIRGESGQGLVSSPPS